MTRPHAAAFLLLPAVLSGAACGAIAGLSDHELVPQAEGGAGGAAGGGGGEGGIGGAPGGAGGSEAQVVVLAEGQQRPHAIVVDGSEVFWATELAGERGLWAMATDGSSVGQVQKFADPTNNNPSNVVIGVDADADGLYWTLNMDCDDPNAGVPWDAVQRSARDGQVLQTMWQECTRRPLGIVSDATYVFHTERWEIRRIQKDTQDVRLLAWDQNNAFDIAEAGDRVFWLAEYADDTCVVTSSKETPDANIYEQLFCSAFQEVERRPRALAVDEGFVYWVDTGEVHSASITGGALQTGELVAKPGGVLSAIALDETYVYFTSSSTGSVSRVNKLGGAVEDIALGQDSPRGIAVGDDAVYWTNYVGGQVMRATKP